MEPLGQFLKRQREMREISLTQVSKETKIAANWLELIETDRWDGLPGKAFTRGFLRSYARAIGLDQEDILLRFEGLSRPEAEKTGAVSKKQETPVFKTIVTFVVIAAIVLFLIWFIAKN